MPSIRPAQPTHRCCWTTPLHPPLPLGSASVLGTVPPCPAAQVPERFLRGVLVWGVRLGGQHGLRCPLGAATWENGVQGGCMGVLTTLGMCTPGRVPGSGVRTWWAHPSVGGKGLSLVGNIWPRTHLLGWASPHKCQPKRPSLPPQHGRGQEHAPKQLGASTQHPQLSLMDPTLPNPSSPPNPSVPPTLSTPLPAVSPAQSRHLPSSPQPRCPPPPPRLPSTIVKGLPLPLSAKLIRRWRGRIM